MAAFAYRNETLYRIAPGMRKTPYLRCLSLPEAKRVMYEVHAIECGAHQAGPKMRMKIRHTGDHKHKGIYSMKLSIIVLSER